MNIVAARRTAPAFAAVALVACGTTVVDAPRGAATTTATASTSTSSATSSPPVTSTSAPSTTGSPDPGAGGAGVGGAGVGGAGAGGATACVPVEDPPPSGQASCAELARLVVEDPILEDADGDGALAPGETAKLTVALRDTSGLGFLWYPGLAPESATPGVSVSFADWRYALLACGTDRLAVEVAVAPDVAKGTVASVTVRATGMNLVCPGAPGVEVAIPIE
jgi:hypothetical protein